MKIGWYLGEVGVRGGGKILGGGVRGSWGKYEGMLSRGMKGGGDMGLLGYVKEEE